MSFQGKCMPELYIDDGTDDDDREYRWWRYWEHDDWDLDSGGAPHQEAGRAAQPDALHVRGER